MKLKELYPTCTIIVICAIIATVQAASAVPTINVEPSFQTVSSGENFTVDIYVNPEGNATGGAAYVLYFNNTLLSATSLASGTFFSGYSVNTYGEGINNSTGTIDYGEAIQGSGEVTTDGTLTTITFQAIADYGTSELHFDKAWTELSDPDGYPITMNTSDGSVKITGDEPPTAFLISGHVFNEDGSDCNDPAVNITNLDIGKEWMAEKDASSNYYQLTLASCADVIAGDVLRFDAASSDESQNTTEHTVTQDEVNGGGIFNFNITLGTAESDTTPPIITNIANGTPTDSSVTITWTTDEASDSLVKYGTTSGTYTYSEPNATMVTSHSISLSGLSAGTTYYFVVNSTDASSNSNESEEHSFTTAAESITPPELISCVITPTPPVVQGTNVSVDCLFSESVDYEICIENATGALIEMIGSGTATNPDLKWWNTTTGTPAGTYIVNVTMDNSTSGLSSYNNTSTIRVRGPGVEVGIDCGTVYPYPECATLPITLRGITDYGAGTINLYYDASVVEVSNVTDSDDSSVGSWNVVTPGRLMISALNTAGASGDVVFANVVFNSVENAGGCSDLNLTVDTLGDIYDYEELPYFTTNCSICIEDDHHAPVVSEPSASPDTILNDNGRARVPGTNVSVLSVIVTDENGVASVTINLSPILGPGNDSVPMTNVVGTDRWVVEVNAPYDAGVGQVHNLTVDATDIFGNSNTAKTIELTVLRRGDVVRDNEVNMFDYLYIARYTVGLESAPDELVAGTIPADSHNGVNMLDALYIARYTAHLEPAP